MNDAPTAVDVNAGPTVAADAPRTRPTGSERAGDVPAPEPQTPPETRRSRRSLALPVAAAVVLIILAAAFAYWRSNLGIVKTDNAQTTGDVAPVAALITGTIVKLDISDNQLVHAGQVLVQIDPTDYRLALGSARANLAAAQAQVNATQAQVNAAQAALNAQEEEYSTGLSVARGALQATTPKLPQAQAQLNMERQQTAAAVSQAQEQVTTAQANIASTKANADAAQKTLARDHQLLSEGAIAQAQVDADNAAYETAQAAYLSAQDALRQAQSALLSAKANLQQVTIAEQNITVNQGEIAQARGTLAQAEAGNTLVQQKAQMLAQAQAQTAQAQAQAAQAAQAVTTAQVNLDRTLIRAPADGWVTNRTAELGMVVQPNEPLLSVTIAHDVWVVANLKETQLSNVQVGNPVRITVDAFRGRVFQGHVQSLGAATGSSVALLPPDNATGNFVKVVQLVPVKITLDQGTDPGRLLQVGLSCEVAIDTRRVDK